MIKVKVYHQNPPHFDKKQFSYSKRFCSIEEAEKHIELSKMADINFNNYMGYCSRRRRFFKLSITTDKKDDEPIHFHLIEPQLMRQY